MEDDDIGANHKKNRTLEWVSAASVGIFSGFSGLATQTRAEFHRKLIRFIKGDDDALPDLGDHASEARKAMQTHLEEHATKLDHIATDRINGKITTREFLQKSYEQKNANSHELGKFAAEELGVATEGLGGIFKGTVQRFQFMGTHTRMPIIINAAIATTVGAAGTMMFFNSLNVHNKLDQLVRNQNKQNEK